LEARKELYEAVVRHVDRALPADFENKLDTYLAGLLLIRNSYALKRLGDFTAAFKAAKAAVALDGDGSKAVWVG
jgi:hypothetical protein